MDDDDAAAAVAAEAAAAAAVAPPEFTGVSSGLEGLGVMSGAVVWAGEFPLDMTSGSDVRPIAVSGVKPGPPSEPLEKGI